MSTPLRPFGRRALLLVSIFVIAGCDDDAPSMDDAGVETDGSVGGGDAAIDMSTPGDMFVPDPCAEDNGGCDPLTECTPSGEEVVCGDCPDGYDGNGLDGCTDIDECATDNGGCDPLASCTNTDGGRTCGMCPMGYEDELGDGTSCVDIDECAEGTDGCSDLVECTNTDGSYTCGDCPTGYVDDGAGGCMDIDECATDNGGCDPLTTCTNTDGSRTCGDCPSGYSGDGASGCADVNECATDNGGCEQTCTNSDGGFSCSCGTGYVLAADGASCDDVNECATGNGGCEQTCTNSDGGFSCSCGTGYVLAADLASCTALRSCADVLAANPSATDGVYTLLGRGDVGYDAYCDMTTDGGGWTLVLKADGRLTNFSYDAALWTGTTTVNPANSDFDNTEALLESYFSVGFTEVRVGIEDPIPGTRRFLTLTQAGSSLSALIGGGTYTATSVGREAWKGLMASGSLQVNCNREGFNARHPSDANPAWPRVRIGILGNQEGDCNSPDSRIGIGGNGNTCGQNDSISVGNAAGCSPDNGTRNTPGYGFVFVR